MDAPGYIWEWSLILALAGVGLAGCGKPTPTYTNPVGDGLEIADPFVLRHDDLYYLYGTTDSGKGFRYWTSRDLVHWEARGWAYQKDDDSWGRSNFWAPEVVAHDGKFFLAYSSKGPAGDGEGMRICLAVADHPGGPFRDLHAPLFELGFPCIDAHVFFDPDGTPYLFFEKVGAVGNPGEPDGYLWGQIYGVPLKPDLSGLAGDLVLCIEPTEPWEGPDDDFARSTEGMTVIAHRDSYLMTYSANHYKDPDYGVGTARAPHPLGPWEKSRRNPILQKDLSIGVSGPGHNSLIRSPDGSEWFMVYHAHADPENPSHRRVLQIDRVKISDGGELSVEGPTRSPQPMPSGVPEDWR